MPCGYVRGLLVAKGAALRRRVAEFEARVELDRLRGIAAALPSAEEKTGLCAILAPAPVRHLLCQSPASL